MKIKDLQEYLKKAIDDEMITPDNEVEVYDTFHDDYEKIENAYADGNIFIIEF